MEIKTYIIGLKDRFDRRTALNSNFKEFDYEYYDAVKGEELDIQKLIQDNVISDCIKSPLTGIMTKGVIGCALSHLNVWKKIIDEGHDTALILEDDVFLDTHINTLNSAFDNIKKLNGWDVVFLGKQTVDIINHRTNPNNYQEYVDGISNFPEDLHKMRYGAGFFCAHAYVLSRSGVQKLVEQASKGIDYPIDVFIEEMKKYDFQIYTTARSLIRQKSHAILDTLNTQNNLADIDSDTWVNKRNKLKSLSIEVDFDMIKKIEIKKSNDNYLKEEPYVYMFL